MPSFTLGSVPLRIEKHLHSPPTNDSCVFVHSSSSSSPHITEKIIMARIILKRSDHLYTIPSLPQQPSKSPREPLYIKVCKVHSIACTIIKSALYTVELMVCYITTVRVPEPLIKYAKTWARGNILPLIILPQTTQTAQHIETLYPF